MSERDHAEADIGPGIRRLALVVGLPLVDGVFITLVLTGALDSLSGILVTGLVVFAGSAAAAIVLADCSCDPAHQLGTIVGIGAVVVPVAALQAWLAPTLIALVDVAVLRRFAALVLVFIAIDLAGWRLARVLPAPAAVVGIGLLVSLDPAGLALRTDPSVAFHGAVAALLGILVLASVALAGARIRPYLDAGRVRSTGAAALVVLALATVGVVPPVLALAVLLGGIGLSVAAEGLGGAQSPTSAPGCSPGGYVEAGGPFR